MSGCRSFERQANLGTLLDATTPNHQHTGSPEELPHSDQSELLVESAIAAEERGDYSLAFSQYRQALTDNPDHLHGNRRLAALHAKRGETNESINLFANLILKHPRNPELLCDYAYALYLDDQFPQADQELQKALTLNPELMRARGLRGMILARTGEIDRAVSEFADAGIRKAEIHANIALAMLLNGDTAAAKTSLDNAERFQAKQETRDRIEQYRMAITQIDSDPLNNTTLSTSLKPTQTL